MAGRPALRNIDRATMIATLFGFFALAWVPWALAALLVFGAMAVWLAFRRRLRPVIGGLDRALAAIEQSGSPAAFRDHFSSLNQTLADNPVIGDSWRAFAQTLVAVPHQDGALGGTRRPEDHFDERILARAGVNLRLYAAVPNYLVGLGLLFTFLGLVAALYFASAGVASTSVQDAQGALRDLLAAATFKFVTSIAGLGASIVYSWREKSQLYQVGRLLARLCTALEQRLVPVTPELLGVLQLEESRNHATLLRRLGRSLHVTIPETIEERLAGELIDAMQPLREGFAIAAARLADLDGQLASRLTLAAAPRADATPIGATQPADERVSAALLDELRRLRAAIEDLPELLPAAAPAVRPGDVGLAQALPRFLELFDTSTAGLDALAGRLETALRRVKPPLERLRAMAHGDVGSAESGLAELASSLLGLAAMRQELEGLGRMFRDVAADSRVLLEAHHARAAGGDPDLPAALDQLCRNVQRFNERVRSFVGQVDEELARSSQLLDQAVSSRAREAR